jgi:hypothetical protein
MGAAMKVTPLFPKIEAGLTTQKLRIEIRRRLAILEWLGVQRGRKK